MCLREVFDGLEKKFKNKKIGWKVFEKNVDGGLLGLCFNYERPRPTGKWLDEADFREIWNQKNINQHSLYSFPVYPTGWHLYLSREVARSHSSVGSTVVKKVRFRKPLVWGIEEGPSKDLVVVAKEIFIEK